MTNYERIISMSKEELAEEIELIANWSRKEVYKANKIEGFFLDYLDKEVNE